MIKIAVKLIKCGCWKVRFADQDYYSSQKRYERKKRYEQHIARMLQFIGDSVSQKQVQLRY
jgi:predicted metalloendopeptidase